MTMLRRSPIALMLIAAAGSTMFGCATPQPALDQANNSANLMMSLQAQLDKLHAHQAAIAQERLASVRVLRSALIEGDVQDKQAARIMAAAGNSQQAELYETLQGITDAHGQDLKDLETAQAALDDSLAKVVAAVPSSSASMAAAGKAMGALGVQRSSAERIAFAKAYAKEVKADVKAADASASAVVPAAAASTPSKTQIDPKAVAAVAS